VSQCDQKTGEFNVTFLLCGSWLAAQLSNQLTMSKDVQYVRNVCYLLFKCEYTIFHGVRTT